LLETALKVTIEVFMGAGHKEFYLLLGDDAIGN
jgi:hypothetical protein